MSIWHYVDILTAKGCVRLGFDAGKARAEVFHDGQTHAITADSPLDVMLRIVEIAEQLPEDERNDMLIRIGEQLMQWIKEYSPKGKPQTSKEA